MKAETSYGTFQAKAHDLVCFRPTERIKWEADSPTFCYQIHVEFASPPQHRLTPFLQGIGPLPVHLSLGDSFEDARDCFEIMCLEITQRSIVNRLRMCAAIYDLLAIVAAVMVPSAETVQHLDAWLRIQQRLDFTLNKELMIKEMARDMNLSTEYFIRQFKNRFSVSPRAYHLQVRLREAMRLLRGGGKSIKEVAFRLGFDSPKKFTRCFKQHFGMVPSDLLLEPLSKEMESSQSGDKLFPINQHLLPTGTRPIWFKQFVPKSKAALSEDNEIVDKIRHPEKYV